MGVVQWEHQLLHNSPVTSAASASARSGVNLTADISAPYLLPGKCGWIW